MVPFQHHGAIVALDKVVLWCYNGAMPSINLRLQIEEHETLVRWATENKRSLQQEIIWRLFSARLTAGEAVGASQSGKRRSTHSSPNPTKCVREARHHINHSGNPCPKCGWPTIGEKSTEILE